MSRDERPVWQNNPGAWQTLEGTDCVSWEAIDGETKAKVGIGEANRRFYFYTTTLADVEQVSP